jgi:hypothetical protein
MRRWHVLALGLFLALALVPTASAYAIDAYVRWSIENFLQQAAPVTATVTLPGNTLRIEGAPLLFTGNGARQDFLFHARYGDEFVGSWRAYKDGTRAYTVGSLVVVIPGEDFVMFGIHHVFVRTRRGTWHETQLNFRDLAAGDPPELTAAVTSISVEDLRTIRATLGPRNPEQMADCWIESFSEERGELLARYQAPYMRPGRLHLALSPEGDAWRLTAIDDLSGGGKP